LELDSRRRKEQKRISRSNRRRRYIDRKHGWLKTSVKGQWTELKRRRKLGNEAADRDSVRSTQTNRETTLRGRSGNLEKQRKTTSKPNVLPKKAGTQLRESIHLGLLTSQQLGQKGERVTAKTVTEKIQHTYLALGAKPNHQAKGRNEESIEPTKVLQKSGNGDTNGGAQTYPIERKGTGVFVTPAYGQAEEGGESPTLLRHHR